ncbi:MAG: phage tail protein [Solirubrobacterales bacterium]|nr:phage tail protein [Solirubrobacterales bacterium]
MSAPFIAEIRMWGCAFAPTGWAFCDGQLMPISQNTALFSLIGTYYGGDGRSNFALPDLRTNVPMFWGTSPGGTQHFLGETGGATTETLQQSEVPAHAHALQASARPADLNGPGPQNSLARSAPASIYKQPTGAATPQPLAAASVQPAGSGMPHNNLMPYLTLNFCIALQGIFPPRS